MIELIEDIKDDLIQFFVNEDHSFNMVTTLRIRLGFSSLEVSFNGISDVNIKFVEKHPHLIAANNDESELAMFVYRPALHEDACAISLCCVKRDKIFDFVSDHGDTMVPMNQFRGKAGDDMILAFLKFRQKTTLPCLKPSTAGAGFEIIKFKRSLKTIFKKPVGWTLKEGIG